MLSTGVASTQCHEHSAFTEISETSQYAPILAQHCSHHESDYCEHKHTESTDDEPIAPCDYVVHLATNNLLPLSSVNF